jgi:hypothetical protein
LAVTPSNFTSQTANTILAAPNGSAGVPTFRTLVAADIPTLNQNTTGTASNVTGTVAIANGGTALTSIPAKSIIVANNANVYAAISPTAGQSIRINAGNTSWETYTPTTGTVTSVSSLTLGTNGNDLSSSVATGTTTPIITLNVPNASASNRGVLTSTDWTTFNNKLNLTGGTLTGNLVVNGTTRLVGNVAINTTTAFRPLEVHSNANDFVSVGVRELNQGQWSGIHFGNVLGSDYRKSAIVFQRTDYGVGDYSGKIHLLNVPPFSFSENASLAYARMTINSNGNVGINDTLPTSTLSVNGTLAVTSDITENGNNVLTNADTTSMLLPYLRRADTTSMLLPYFRDNDTTLLNLTSRFAAKQNTLTNPVTGTGTINYIPKFTSTGSTIGNSTLIDNGTTISTASILSTTNYASFNTAQLITNNSGLGTHRFTNANANGVYNKSFFLTSYMSGSPWRFFTVSGSQFSRPPIVSIINNTDSLFIHSGLHLMTTSSTNNTYTPALTFGVNSENGVYYNTIGAITAKKLNTGQATSLSTGQLEFFGTGTSLDATGASMTTANMTLGVGVGIGYATAPTVRGRLIVSQQIGIGNDSPTNTLDVSGTFRATGAATLSSTLAVQGAITEGGIDVIKGSGTSSYIPKFSDTDAIGNSSILDNNGIIVFDSSIVVNGNLSVTEATYFSGYQKETGTTLGDFDVIASGTSIYIFENTSAGSGTTTKEFISSASSNTGRVITIANISDNAWDMAFTSVKPYIKTNTTINQVSSGQSITILSDGSKWLVISRNF